MRFEEPKILTNTREAFKMLEKIDKDCVVESPEYKDTITKATKEIVNKAGGLFQPMSMIVHKGHIDRFIGQLIAHKIWASSKEIFEIDDTFKDEISEIVTAKYDFSIFNLLPYKTFAILDKDGYWLIHNTMDYIPPNGDKIENVLHCFYIYDKGDLESYSFNLAEDIEMEKYFEESVDIYGESFVKNRKKALTSLLNILTYLCSESADIVENPEQKQITRRTDKVKNTYREIRKFNVGFRYGNAFRKHIKYKSDAVSTGGGSKKCPHIRRGHFHHYWVGKRDEERKLVVKWIPPVTINTKDSDDCVATIHKISK